MTNTTKPDPGLNLIKRPDVEEGSHVDVDDLQLTPATTMRAKRRNGLTSYISRNGGYIFFACVFVLFMRTGFLAGHNDHHAESYASNNDIAATLLPSAGGWIPHAAPEHPITKRIEAAEAKHKAKVAGQSKTLKAAVAEYKRRYKRAPPKGFDQWWNFAQEHNVKFVDDYDGMVSDLAPFWELSGEELRRRALQVGELPSIDLVRLQDGKATTLNIKKGFEDSEVSARATGFRAMLGKFAHTLPDMYFPINAKAEGRVLVPWEHRKYPNLTLEDSSGQLRLRISSGPPLISISAGVETMLNGPFQPDWGNDGTVWEAWRRTCAPTSAARRVFSSLRNVFTPQRKNYLAPSSNFPSSDFLFAATTSARTVDFCSQPHEHYAQGHFFSDWRTLPLLYPVFSPARAEGFLDIRIPSHYYYGSTKRYTYGWDP
ncbi:hypothetical protein DXG01_012720, partial [Tephrocybe rancida]